MARTFDGSNDVLKNTSFSVVANRSKFTMSAFMKRASGNKAMFGCYGSGLQHSMGVLLWSDGNAYVVYGNGDATQYAYVANTVYDTYQHVFLHFDGTLTGNSNRLKLWIDGVQQTLTFNVNTNTTTSSSLTELWVGARPNGPEYGVGAVTRLAIWYGVDMGATEASAIAGGTAPSTYSSGLVDYWPCTTTSGDEVGSTYTLTDTGGVGYEADPSFGGGGTTYNDSIAFSVTGGFAAAAQQAAAARAAFTVSGGFASSTVANMAAGITLPVTSGFAVASSATHNLLASLGSITSGYAASADVTTAGEVRASFAVTGGLATSATQVHNVVAAFSATFGYSVAPTGTYSVSTAYSMAPGLASSATGGTASIWTPVTAASSVWTPVTSSTTTWSS